MGRILVIPNSNFSQNRIVKVDITEQVEKTLDSHTLTSTVSDNNPSLKNNNQ